MPKWMVTVYCWVWGRKAWEAKVRKQFRKTFGGYSGGTLKAHYLKRPARLESLAEDVHVPEALVVAWIEEIIGEQHQAGAG